MISTSDPLSHTVTISYTDSFSTNGNPTTLAYPTSVTDPDSKTSSTQYDYDLGAAKVTTDPKGATLTSTFDSAGRVTKIESNLTENTVKAYTRFEYPDTMTEVRTYVLQSTGPTVEIYSAQFLDGAGRLIATRRELPGSTGGYSGQKFVYDSMGRVSQQSNPAEINSAGVPVGDDAAGWNYTTQSYDWKGRPRITTNTDSTTKEITYGGCGCAGGEVVTIQDEVGRQQRMTYDVLGRLMKTEGLNTDQQHSVYVTRTDTYNARDQITNIFVQQSTNGAGQSTVMIYDGHGRLQTRKAPIETNPTTYLYYADDTVKRIIEPRGTQSDYTYNNRHLVTGIVWCKTECPTNAPDQITAIPLTDPVGFGYDDAGNRLWMTDGLGQVNYVRDTWSRLSSETRTFTDFPNNSYPVTYTYNLAGQVKSITDPDGKAINYAYDQGGQLTGVTAVAQTAFAGVLQYATSMQYRAWGALKHVTKGNGASLDFGYNTRLQLTSSNHFGPTNTYEYYGDGRIKFVHGGGWFDRKYEYDHMGRLSLGYSGSDARGEPYDPKNPPPYKQTYSYSVFNHMTARTNRFWTQDQGTFTAIYSNDRNTAWGYDDAGNVTSNGYGTYKFDTAGRMKEFSRVNTVTITQYYDGDGLPAYRSEARPGLTDRSIIYYVRSSVLGGQTITELANGVKRRTYVYANGDELARQEKITNAPDAVTWVSRDPITSDETSPSTISRDPLGGYFGNENDVNYASYEDLKGNSPTHERDADPFSSGMGCTVDGVSIDCDVFASMVNNGAVLKQFFGGGGEKDRTLPVLSYGSGSFDQGFRLEWVPDEYKSTISDKSGVLKLSGTLTQGHWISSGAFSSPSVGVLGVRFQNQGPRINFLPNDGEIYNPGKWNPIIRETIQSFLDNPDCVNAYAQADVDLPELLRYGIDIGPSNAFRNMSAQQLKLTQPQYNQGLAWSKSSGGLFSDAGPAITTVSGNGTTDHVPKIFLRGSAFEGGVFQSSVSYLREVLAHELLHAGGWDSKPHKWTIGAQDLDWLGERFKRVMKMCP